MLRDKLARLLSVGAFVSITFCSFSSFADVEQPAPPPDWQQITHASWYGNEFAGRPMATGGLFNPARLTAAHRTLALGTWVKVTELRTSRSVVVQITDRGPYVRNRGIDLSYAAARQLGIVRRGVAHVRVEKLGNTVPPAPSALMTVSSCNPNPLLPGVTAEWRRHAGRYSPACPRSEMVS
jgi:rare lipoprotein A